MSGARFPYRIEAWVSPQFASAISSIADARSLSESAIVREAILVYLRQYGIEPTQRPAPNGAQRADHAAL